MRLKKDEREEFERTIAELSKLPRLTEKQQDDYEWAWQRLAWDHFAKLRLDLDHIGSIQLREAIKSDALGSSVTAADLIRMYSKDEKFLILSEIREARKSLDWLEEVVKQPDEPPQSEKVISILGRDKRSKIKKALKQ